MIYLSNRDGNGKTSEEGHYRLQTRMLKGFNLLPNDLKVLQNSPLGMKVIVSTGDYRIETGDYAYTGWINPQEVIDIPTANTVNPRIDTIVLYVDKLATTTPTPPNNPNVTKLAVISGTPAALPVASTDTEIRTLIGSNNPYYILATISIGANVNQITNANITDKRVAIGIADSVVQNSNLLSAVGPLLYPVGSIYVNKTVATNPGTLFGFGTWVAIEGYVVVGKTATGTFSVAGSTGGAETHTLTVAQMPSHDHATNWRPFMSSGTGSFTLNDRGGDAIVISDNAAHGSNGENLGDVRSIVNHEGGGTAHNNLQPYIVAYMWERTA